MHTYKIHSLKDNNKFSFIIQWEDISSVTKKLSSEGYIIISIDKVQVGIDESFFHFYGKKKDGSIVEWKVSSEDIFQAYLLLTKEYQYILTELYPGSISDPTQQKKIFQELLLSFREDQPKKKEITIDTLQEFVIKNKKNIQLISQYLTQQTHPNTPQFIENLRKIEKLNNSSLIKDALIDLIKKLYNESDSQQQFITSLRPVIQDLWVFLLPPFLFLFLQKIESLYEFLRPAFLTENKNTPTLKTKIPPSKKIQDILKNTHIQLFLKKKYRNTGLFFLKNTEKQAYQYSLYRANRMILTFKNLFSFIFSIFTITIISFIFFLCLSTLLGHYPDIYISHNILILSLSIITCSLVFQKQMV